jgi:hypothetical protein
MVYPKMHGHFEMHEHVDELICTSYMKFLHDA